MYINNWFPFFYVLLILYVHIQYVLQYMQYANLSKYMTIVLEIKYSYHDVSSSAILHFWVDYYWRVFQNQSSYTILYYSIDYFATLFVFCIIFFEMILLSL